MSRPKYVASGSGGIDSVATLLLAPQHHEPLDEAFFSEVMFEKDTSGEVPEHRDFIYDRLKPFCEKGDRIKKRAEEIFGEQPVVRFLNEDVEYWLTSEKQTSRIADRNDRCRPVL